MNKDIKKELYIALAIGLTLMLLSNVSSYFKEKKLKELETTIRQINTELLGNTNLNEIRGKIITQKNDTIILLDKSFFAMQPRIIRLKNQITSGEIAFSALEDSISVLRDLTNQYIEEIDRETRNAIDNESVTSLCVDDPKKKEKFEILQREHEYLSITVRNLPPNCE